jgi:DNA-binding MarR family transcriptional regulator
VYRLQTGFRDRNIKQDIFINVSVSETYINRASFLIPMERITKIRRSRSPVFLDYDDFLIINLCMVGRGENIAYLKKFLNLTQKAIGIHINRLVKYGLVSKEQGQGEAFRERLILPTEEGKTIFEIYKKAIAKSETLRKELPSMSRKEKN